MVKPAGKKTKGRQRVEMRRIEDKERRQVTFSKRKSGLWKKACEIAVLCRAHVAVVAFSEAGRAFAFTSPSADDVLGRYVPVSGDGDAPVPAADDADLDEDHDEVVATCRAMEEKSKEVAAEAARKKAIGEKVVKAQAQAGKQFWWEVDVEALGAAELPEFTRALRRLKENVRRRADNLLSTLPPPQQ